MLATEGKQAGTPLAQLHSSHPHPSINHCTAFGTDGGRCDHATTEMHRVGVVEPDAGKPRRGARRAARALPPTNGEQATALAATRRP